MPDSTTDIASFARSRIIQPVVTGLINLGSLNFVSGADAFTITLMPTQTLGTVLFFNEAGVINNSGKVQTFGCNFGTAMFFYNSATAGQLMNYQGDMGAAFIFYDSSSAGSASFDLVYGPNGPGLLNFNDSATAADSSISAISSDVFFFITLQARTPWSRLAA